MKENLDAAAIQPEREQLNFQSVAQRFHLIPSGLAQPVAVAYAESEERLDALRAEGPSRDRLRALQPFLVNVYPDELASLEAIGALEPVAGCLVALVKPFWRIYTDDFGLLIEDSPSPDPEGFIC
jgi:hypothetical protein